MCPTKRQSPKPEYMTGVTDDTRENHLYVLYLTLYNRNHIVLEIKHRDKLERIDFTGVVSVYTSVISDTFTVIFFILIYIW